MKSLILTFTFIGSMFLLAFTPKADISTEERMVVMTIKYKNGEQKTEKLTFTESLKLENISRNDSKEVIECTVGFSNGECTTTASSCAAATAGFRACACSLGYGKMC